MHAMYELIEETDDGWIDPDATAALSRHHDIADGRASTRSRFADHNTNDRVCIVCLRKLEGTRAHLVGHPRFQRSIGVLASLVLIDIAQ